VAILDIEILGGGKPILRDAQPGRTIPQDHQTVSVLIRQWPQQECADDAKDGGVSADTDGKRQDRSHSEAGAPGKRPESVFEVSNQILHG
jgi:hypothetical protein